MKIKYLQIYLNMKKVIFILIISVIVCHISFSQRTLIEEDVTTYDFNKPINGPNLMHFTHWYLGLGFYTPDPLDDAIDIMYVKTHNFTVGYRYKLKATKWLAFGADLEYNTASYFFKNSFFNDSVFPDQTTHDVEKLRMNNFGTEIFIRFNFGKRGNIIGKFVDFAAYGLLNFDAKHIYIDKLSTPVFYNAKTVKVVNSKLNYIEFPQYGVRFRLGYNRYALCVSYRLSDILTQKFKTENSLFELPRLNVDFQIGLH
jgi:hypothetical protein